jgi:hypothetical protein
VKNWFIVKDALHKGLEPKLYNNHEFTNSFCSHLPEKLFPKGFYRKVGLLILIQQYPQITKLKVPITGLSKATFLKGGSYRWDAFIILKRIISKSMIIIML